MRGRDDLAPAHAAFHAQSVVVQGVLSHVAPGADGNQPRALGGEHEHRRRRRRRDPRGVHRQLRRGVQPRQKLLLGTQALGQIRALRERGLRTIAMLLEARQLGGVARRQSPEGDALHGRVALARRNAQHDLAEHDTIAQAPHLVARVWSRAEVDGHAGVGVQCRHRIDAARRPHQLRRRRFADRQGQLAPERDTLVHASQLVDVGIGEERIHEAATLAPSV